MPFKSLTDLPTRINPQMKKNRYAYASASALNRKHGYTPEFYWLAYSILAGDKNEKLS